MNSSFEFALHLWPGGNDYAWDVKGLWFESDQGLFFSNGNFLNQLGRHNICLLVFCRLSCHIYESFIFAVN